MHTQTTKHGTPHANTWDPAWTERVENAEARLNRRICGARTRSGEPCTLHSNHPTGRCRYHGGTDAIGAPIGNQNAQTHGLYARRLQRCGTHCAIWQHCPFADADVLALDPPDRPICAYESAEYEEVLDDLGRDALPRVHNDSGHAGACPSPSNNPQTTDDHTLNPIRENPSYPQNPRTHSVHNLALLQVMFSRAAAALSVTGLTDEVRSETERYQLYTVKVHAALEAFLRIGRELRAVQTAYERTTAGASPSPTEHDALFSNPLDDEMLEFLEECRQRQYEAEGQSEEYTRRLEWIAHNHLGATWREHESIREYALPRATPQPGAPTHDPRISTQHPPPHEHPPPLNNGTHTENARSP